MTTGIWEGQSKKGRKSLQDEAYRQIIRQQRSISLEEAASEEIANENCLLQGIVQIVAREEARKIITINIQQMINKHVNKERKEQERNEKRKRKN